jgi:hypothetical protein
MPAVVRRSGSVGGTAGRRPERAPTGRPPARGDPTVGPDADRRAPPLPARARSHRDPTVRLMLRAKWLRCRRTDARRRSRGWKRQTRVGASREVGKSVGRHRRA